MAFSRARCANISPSKRSFDETLFLKYHNAHYAVAAEQDNLRPSNISPYSLSKRRLSSSHPNVMLAESNTIMSGSFPSFMSVYGNEESDVYQPVELDDHKKVNQDAFSFMAQQNTNVEAPQQHTKPYHHRGSVSSLFSESTESSPTTTNSTFDSPIVSDTSPSASPESASSCVPPSSFMPNTMHKEEKALYADEDKQPPANFAEPQILQDTTKNVKKLTLDMDLSAIRRPATSHVSETAHHPLSAPSSPLKEPMKSARKKPNNLTIRTPGYSQLTFPRATGIVPATPSSRPALHQYQSSPSLSSFASPRAGPAGGMFLPLPSLNTQHAKSSSSSSNGSSFMGNSMPDLREENESQILKSQEAPERGYTEGPVCIYDCGVYLYLEPTAEEAKSFDTVINVAKEVKNPLKDPQAGEGTIMSVWRGDQPNKRYSITEPQTAVSEYSFKSAWEFLPQPRTMETPTATTPTQTSFAGKPKEPEYVHVKWDHNSEILEDLYPLCKLIDSRVAEGKKVLIHCQLGVSRSASLIIAYGLFKDYQQSFHAMYATVKERSRWVGPNMSLIYQLTDFKNRLNKGDYAQGGREAKPEWFVRSPEGPLTPATVEATPSQSTATDPISLQPIHTEATLSQCIPSVPGAFPSSDLTVREPAPTKLQAVPPKLNKALPPVPLFSRYQSTLPSQPTSATSTMPPPPPKISSTVKRAASRPLPFRERGLDADATIKEHKPRKVPGFALAQSSAFMDLAMQDAPSTPSLFSPRATEFMATPFGVRGAGDLEQPRNRISKEVPSGFNWLPLRKDSHVRTASKDPRSPHQEAEAKEIFRSIDNYL